MILKQTDFKVKDEFNGIKYCVNGEGWEFYYSTHTQIAAMNIRGVARMLKCNAKTIYSILRSVTFSNVKVVQVPTMKGIRTVTLILEQDLPKLLNHIIDSTRIKNTTRVNAKLVRDSFTEAGFKLMVMLNVAPEVVAITAIEKVEESKAIEWVEARLESRKSNLSLNRTLADHGVRGNRQFGYNTNQLYLGLMGGKAADIKVRMGVKSIRDNVSREMLNAIMFTEDQSSRLITSSNAQGYKSTGTVIRFIATKVREIMDYVVE